MFDLTGRAALITGSSRGIGRAIALQLARQGASIAVNYLRNEDAAKDVQATIRSYEGQAVLLQGNVSDPEQAERVVDMAQDAFGRLDILVNNAGFNRDTLILRMSVQDWDEVMATNLRAVFLCTKAALRHMLKQRWGRIVNIGSVSGIAGNAGQANYAAAKAGLIGFTKAVAREMGSRSITANVVAPGLVLTELTEHIPQQVIDMAMDRVFVGRVGRPEDIAACVAFLASEEASYISGQVIPVDGGLGN
ncbi:MAG: 3-oxoacyl-[acyl-carrier-protein] reductase [Dehalococcoidia bacterium]|nr:3-oxoacyl-[acyl-carrier-protein] reductase [Dehalococcoidia bacterium]